MTYVANALEKAIEDPNLLTEYAETDIEMEVIAIISMRRLGSGELWMNNCQVSPFKPYRCVNHGLSHQFQPKKAAQTNADGPNRRNYRLNHETY